jgi:hypothetical protein
MTREELSALRDAIDLTLALPARIPEPAQTVKVMLDSDIKVRRDPMLRLPRQIEPPRVI